MSLALPIMTQFDNIVVLVQ